MGGILRELWVEEPKRQFIDVSSTETFLVVAHLCWQVHRVLVEVGVGWFWDAWFAPRAQILHRGGWGEPSNDREERGSVESGTSGES